MLSHVKPTENAPESKIEPQAQKLGELLEYHHGCFQILLKMYLKSISQGQQDNYDVARVDKIKADVITLGPKLRALLQACLYSPDQVKRIARPLTTLPSIQFFDYGISMETWSLLALACLATDHPEKRAIRPTPAKNLAHHTHHEKLNPTPHKTLFEELQKQGWQFECFQGRTVLFQQSERQLHIKYQKKNEPSQALHKEFVSTQYLYQEAKRLQLNSQFPQAKEFAVMPRQTLQKWLTHCNAPAQMKIDFQNSIVDTDESHIYLYLYETNKHHGYSTYLHDPTLSWKAFCEANRVIVNDLYRLLNENIIYHQLADIFHNSEDKVKKRMDQGRYLVLTNLLRFWPLGSGRITGWLKAVEYPNLRKSGLADLGDWISAEDFSDKYYLATSPFKVVAGQPFAAQENLIMANFIAEYQYILQLIAGRRGRAITASLPKDDTRIPVLWEHLAELIVNNCAQAISIMTRLSEQAAKSFLVAWIDVKRYARQMQYWMTDEYIADLLQNKIPADIYGAETKVEIDIKRFRRNTFNKRVGCSINHKDPDLGPVNGQEPIKEGNKLFYALVTVIDVAKQQVALESSSSEEKSAILLQRIWRSRQHQRELKKFQEDPVVEKQNTAKELSHSRCSIQ
jgi:hypothetical protein